MEGRREVEEEEDEEGRRGGGTGDGERRVEVKVGKEGAEREGEMKARWRDMGSSSIIAAGG